MHFCTLNNSDIRVTFENAIFNGLAPDNSLYMPVEVPQLKSSFFEEIEQLSFEDICIHVAEAWIGNEIPREHLANIIQDAMNFPVPLNILGDDTAVLELFHGPSMAFKDFGARFMSRVMSYFWKDCPQTLDILVATSGDTGGAVALGFFDVPNIRVTILFPKGKVSALQEMQISSLGKNIRAVEVDGTFDDCQTFVKQAFLDPELKRNFRMSSANSINVSRLIPQTFYYFLAYKKARLAGFDRVIFSAPSGNFGNLAAGIMASKMGLPVERFIAATNENDIVPQFLNGGEFKPRPSIQTISNAMDVGNPSNWPRILSLFGNNIQRLLQILSGHSFDDVQTQKAIKEVLNRYNYLVCPHSAIAWLGTQQTPSNGALRIALATAHPCKFPDIYPPEIIDSIVCPKGAARLSDAQQRKYPIKNSYVAFKEVFKALG